MYRGIYFIFFSLILTILGGCGVIASYTAPVTQGKEINDKIIFEIKPSMTKGEIKHILGSSDIIDIFNPNQLIYVNTRKQLMQDKNFSQSKLILTFNNKDKLVGISGNYAPPSKDPVF